MTNKKIDDIIARGNECQLQAGVCLSRILKAVNEAQPGLSGEERRKVEDATKTLIDLMQQMATQWIDAVKQEVER